MSSKRWIYHETEKPKIIDSDKYESFYDDGWRDSPACFIKVADFDVDPDDDVAVQNLGDTVQGVVDALNGALNLDEMPVEETLGHLPAPEIACCEGYATSAGRTSVAPGRNRWRAPIGHCRA